MQHRRNRRRRGRGHGSDNAFPVVGHHLVEPLPVIAQQRDHPLPFARPQRVEDKREVRSEGYDIVLAIDLSSSMLAEDYERGGDRINRLQAIKPVIQAFIEKRPSDRIGIVLFSGRAYTMAPLTFDHDWLSRQLERLKLGMLENGTAIGDGLGVALTRLEQAKREAGGQRQGAFVNSSAESANPSGGFHLAGGLWVRLRT